jgi:hypothetical protein
MKVEKCPYCGDVTVLREIVEVPYQTFGVEHESGEYQCGGKCWDGFVASIAKTQIGSALRYNRWRGLPQEGAGDK